MKKILVLLLMEVSCKGFAITLNNGTNLDRLNCNEIEAKKQEILRTWKGFSEEEKLKARKDLHEISLSKSQHNCSDSNKNRISDHSENSVK